MAKLIFLIGLPSAGKSSYCEAYKVLNPDVVIVSSDAIREEVFGDVNDQLHNQEVFNIVEKRCREALKANKEVVLDATNLNRKRRINFIKVMPKCEVEAVVFAIPFEVCCKRNKNRERTVPIEAMWRMYKSFQPPYYTEGFNKISFIGLEGVFDPYEYAKALRKANINCEHDNPHHRLSCGNHCLAATRWIFENCGMWDYDDALILKIAAEWHDMGKFKCKVFTNAKGEPSEQAHFYNHENVSAYDFLVCNQEEFGREDLILISNLIANHMVYFTGKAAIEKRKKLYGEKFFWYLDRLHEADLAAH